MQRGGLWSPGDRMRTPLTKVGMLPPEAQVSMPWSTQSGAEGTPSPRPPRLPLEGDMPGGPRSPGLLSARLPEDAPHSN